MKSELVFAKMDPAICLSGLFRTLKKGERRKGKLDITFKFGDAIVRFVGFEPLGVDDMRVLQGLVALAGPAGMSVSANTSFKNGLKVRKRMQLQGAAASEDTLAVRTRLKTFLAELGKENPGGRDIKLLRASLLRLANVTVCVTVGSKIGTAHLLSFAADTADTADTEESEEPPPALESSFADDASIKTGELIVNLNPRLSKIILGDSGYTRIEMSEVRALKSDIASLIHQRLCGFIAPGKSREVGLETVMSYAYPQQMSASGVTLRQWRSRVRLALEELRALPGWEITEARRGVFKISRKRLA